MPDAAPPITPAPLPPGVREVLLFGGTFDPPHAAHIELPVKVRDAMLGPGAWLLFVPAARNPLKSRGPDASEIDRLRMLRLAIAERIRRESESRVATWTDEFDRVHACPGPSYTIDTVNRLRRVGPQGLDVRLLIGSDQAATFHRWREARALFEETRPIVLLRDPLNTTEALRTALAASGAWTDADIKAWISRAAPIDVVDISSTALRALLHAPTRDRSALLKVLTPSVLSYIESNGLYR
jgi:nicotinate-nucleotide adenylyltransferase